MKPGDHPEFYRLPPPEGRSRESTIRLDANGRFWHDDRLVEHAGMAQAFASWIARHPDDGRYILSNGYDWTYFTVEDVPFFVAELSGTPPELRLFDGTAEQFDPARVWMDARGAAYTMVKAGQFVARFSSRAQLELEPYLREGPGGRIMLEVSGRQYVIDRK